MRESIAVGIILINVNFIDAEIDFSMMSRKKEDLFLTCIFGLVFVSIGGHSPNSSMADPFVETFLGCSAGEIMFHSHCRMVPSGPDLVL